MHGQRDGGREQEQQDQGQQQRQGQRQAVADQLGQVFAGLRKYSSHVSILATPNELPRTGQEARPTSILGGELTLLAGLLHHRDEDIFQRIALLVNLAHFHAHVAQPLSKLLFGCFYIVIHNHV